MSLNAPPLARHAGFSMLEVLIALIVISLGLLGIAGMQAAAINNTGIARSRSLGAIAADSMAAAMHANVAYWSNLSAVNNNTWTVNAGGVTSVNNSPSLTQTTDCSTANCTATAMAAYDTTQWGSGMLATLPGGSGQIACTAATSNSPASCTITVSWLEKLSKVNSTNMAASATATAQYQMAVVP